MQNTNKRYYGTATILSGLIDAALAIALFLLIYHFALPALLAPVVKAYPNLSIVVLYLFYRLVTILLFDATPGMKLMHLVFLNSREEGLSIKEKIMASFFILFRGVDYYRLY